MRFHVHAVVIFVLSLQIPAFARPHVVDIEGYYLADTIYEYSILKTPKEFAEKFGKGWSPEDREFIEGHLKKMQTLPTLSRKGRIVTLKNGDFVLKIDLADMRDRVVYFNGHKMRLNPNQPIRVQVNRLLGKLRQSSEYGAWSLIVPQAHALAFVPILAAGGTVVAMGLVSKIIDRYGNAALDSIDYHACRVAIESLEWDWKEATACKKYVDSLKAKAKENPEIIAAKTSVPEAKPSDTPIETALERCPHEMSGEDKDKAYTGTYFLIKEAKRVHIRASIEGKKFSKIEVFDFGTGELLATYKVNSENELEEMEVPNKKSDDGKLTSSALKIPAATKIDDPKIAAQQSLHQKLFAHLGLRMAVCKAYKAAEDAREAKRQQPAVAPSEGQR